MRLMARFWLGILGLFRILSAVAVGALPRLECHNTLPHAVGGYVPAVPQNSEFPRIHHSFLSASIGSTPAARHAGTADATSAASTSISAANASMIGSHGLTPNS